MGLLMGIDLGTSSVKALLMDEAGQVLGVSSAEYPILIPEPGAAEQDPQAWWKAASLAIREAIHTSGEPASRIKAIGLSGQMHGMVPLDSTGRLSGRPSSGPTSGRGPRSTRSIGPSARPGWTGSS